MSLKQISRRLDDLEASCMAERLLVLVETSEGQKIMTVDQMLENGKGFRRVVSGNSLRDLDKILDYIEERAYIAELNER